jgi:hypothetical protein
MDRVCSGDRLVSKKGSRAVLIFLSDEHREVLKDDGNVTCTKDGLSPQGRVEVSKSSLKIGKSLVDELPKLDHSEFGSTTIARGDDSDAEPPPPLSPMLAAHVADIRPDFAWHAVRDVSGYRVQLARSSSAALWTEESKQANLSYPTGQPPLKRGARYQWHVIALAQGKPAECATGTFYVMTLAEVAATSALQKLATSDDEADLALAAAGFEGQQMYAEALAVYERLCRRSARPGAFQAARACLLDRAGSTAEAQKAWDQAKRAGFPAAQDEK